MSRKWCQCLGRPRSSWLWYRWRWCTGGSQGSHHLLHRIGLYHLAVSIHCLTKLSMLTVQLTGYIGSARNGGKRDIAEIGDPIGDEEGKTGDVGTITVEFADGRVGSSASDGFRLSKAKQPKSKSKRWPEKLHFAGAERVIGVGGRRRFCSRESQGWGLYMSFPRL